MTVEYTTPVTDQQTDPTFITKRDVCVIGYLEILILELKIAATIFQQGLEVAVSIEELVSHVVGRCSTTGGNDAPCVCNKCTGITEWRKGLQETVAGCLKLAAEINRTAQTIRDAAGRNLVESKKVQKILQELEDLMTKQPDKAEDIVKQAVSDLKRNAQELASLINRREYQGHEPKELENNAEIQTEVGHNESKKDDTMSQTTHGGAPTGSNTSARLTIGDVGTALGSQEVGRGEPPVQALNPQSSFAASHKEKEMNGD